MTPFHREPAPTPTPGQSPTGGVGWDQFGGNPADAPADLDSFITDVLGWMKTLSLYFAVLGALACVAVIVIGIRGRSQVAKKGLEGLPAVLLAVTMASGAAAILGMFV